MRRLRPCGRAIRRDLDRQPTRFGAERAVPKFRAKIAGPPASVYPEIGGCPRADLCAGSEDTEGPVGDPPAMFWKHGRGVSEGGFRQAEKPDRDNDDAS
jgi:hypothetical protein